MPVLMLRPPIAELMFRVFDRPLHPEWYDTFARRSVNHDVGRVTAHITPSGHVFEWSQGPVHLVEAITRVEQEWPPGTRLATRFQAGQGRRCELANGWCYRTTLVVDRLPPELFAQAQEELQVEGPRRGFLHRFEPAHRLAFPAFGAVCVETRPGSLSITATHTFPEELAILQTVSLLENG